MEIGDIFKDSLKYPLNDWVKIIMLGVLFLLISFAVFLPVFAVMIGGGLDILTAIGGIIAFISLFIISGYSINIINKTIRGENNLPEFDLSENLKEGLKLVIMEIGYGIIPMILIIATGWLSGTFNAIYKIIEYAVTNAHTTVATIPQNLLVNLGVEITTLTIVTLIIGIIYTIIITIAIGRLAETDSLKEAFNIKAIFNKIGEIGWGKYIVWLIILFIILMIIGAISGLLTAIPIIGMIISTFVITPYLYIFSSRALGLLYKNY